MTTPKDGGPAFPKQPIYQMPGGVEMMYEQPGMSLRDYFAAAALQGMCANTGTYGINNGPEQIATRAYECADAILRAREGV